MPMRRSSDLTCISYISKSSSSVSSSLIRIGSGGSNPRPATVFHTDHPAFSNFDARSGILPTLPADPLGTVGVIDETSSVKKGEKTPGVQRQYLGCVGKVEDGIVTVHFGVAHGRFQALLDADLYLPKSWDEDRPRCEEAGIPDGVHYLPKWQIALDQYLRLHRNGVRFDWLTFDEGYGSKTPFLGLLSMMR